MPKVAAVVRFGSCSVAFAQIVLLLALDSDAASTSIRAGRCQVRAKLPGV